MKRIFMAIGYAVLSLAGRALLIAGALYGGSMLLVEILAVM